MSAELREDGLRLSADPADLDVDKVHGWLATTYWAKGVSREKLSRSIVGSQVFGVYDADGQQLAFARAVTDDSTYCWVCDVFVDESARGRGIGTWLVGGIVDRLRAKGVQRFVLATKDAHGVYEKVGFRPLRDGGRYMEIDERPTRPDVVAAPGPAE